MTLDSAIGVISRWSSTSDTYVFTGKRDQIDQYLQAVDQIQRSIVSGTAYDHSRAKSAIQIAMLRLADEMCNLLKINCKSAGNPDSSTTMSYSGSNTYVDDYVYSNALSVVVINDLRSIVQRMNVAGCLGNCKTAYINTRKLCIDASYQKLNIEKLSSDDARKMEWEMLLLPKIKVWMTSAKICFRKIFSYEKQLCEEIFRDLGDDIVDDCFLKISNGYAEQLLEIGTNLSCIPIASQRLFGILDLYKTISNLVPEINMLFNTQSSESLRKKADQMVPKLADAATMTIERFEKDLLSVDLSRAVPVDKIHSFCKYVMGYLIDLSQHKQTLMELSLSKPPSTTGGAGMNLRIAEPQQQNELPFHVMWIISCLFFRLENRAKLYQNDSDISFYLMNNFFYIVQKINEKPEVKEMIGDDCFEKVSLKFDQAKDKYLRLTLAEVLRVLGGKMSSKKKLKSFNIEFKKLQINLGKLKVSDFQLLKDIRVLMEEILVPPYASLLEQLSADGDKFSVEELKSAILGFFPSST